MSGEFLGTFTNSVNKQKWITIPSVFKHKFSPNSKQKVIVTIGPVGNVAIFPLDNWNDKIKSLQNGEQKQLKLLFNLRTFASPEQKVEQNGRVKIQDELLEIANIKGKVVLKGEGSYISVWNPDVYNEFRQKMLQEHKQMFNALDYQT